MRESHVYPQREENDKVRTGLYTLVLLAILTSALLADDSQHAPATQPTVTLAKVDLDSGRGAGESLKGGVFVQVARNGDSISVTLKSSSVTRSDHYYRDVVVYLTQPVPTFTIIADRFASDEDRLLAVDMDNKIKPLTISHDPTDPYSHQHYDIVTAQGDTIKIIESEYAGDDEPRQREVILAKSTTGFSLKKGKWEKQGTH